jgi:zinc-finger of transposase IS204/IS1001/IS1096/IS1165
MVSLSLFLFPACPDLLIEDITLESKTVIISVRSTKTSVQCPACARPSAKVHSRYVRVPADLPWMEYGVRLHLEVRRFFCQHEDCSRKTFAEPFPDLVQAHARRTTRQAQLLQEVAFALGGKAGAPLARRLGCAASRGNYSVGWRRRCISGKDSRFCHTSGVCLQPVLVLIEEGYRSRASLWRRSAIYTFCSFYVRLLNRYES